VSASNIKDKAIVGGVEEANQTYRKNTINFEALKPG
jgi:hypothetical protein